MRAYTGDPYLFTPDGDKIPLKDISRKGYKPAYFLPDEDYNSRRGYAKLKFKENQAFYKIIEVLYRHLGTKNIKIQYRDDYIIVETKPILIKKGLSQEEQHVINEALIEGKMWLS